VEVHESGFREKSTFKWSRDNGSVVTEIIKFDGAKITVADVGKDEVLGFANDQWVEVTDDEKELKGLPGQLRKIKNVDPDTKVITLNKEPTVVEKELHPKLRRWDQTETSKKEGKKGAVEMNQTDGGWVTLENGIQVQFSKDKYKTGDYWLIPARTATGEIEWPGRTTNGKIEWPPYKNPATTKPEPQPPLGIRHHFCPLALFFLNDADRKFYLLKDCRKLFPPITKLTNFFYVGGDGQEARPGRELPQPLQVGVANGQRPVAGARVSFKIGQGDGHLEDSGKTCLALTGTDGIACCRWTLDDTTQSQKVEATLLDAGGNSLHLPIRFTANLSRASEVAYASNCSKLSEAKTVQAAIDKLCETADREDGIHINSVRRGPVVPPESSNHLPNNSKVSANELAEGLYVVCDREILPDTIERPTCFVTLEMPFRDHNKTIIGFQPLILAADVKIDRKYMDVIVWKPGDLSWLKSETNAVDILAHLTLKGNFIWAKDNSGLYLDGEAFGIPKDQTEKPCNLDFSGDGRRGGDFEMWFWVTSDEPGGVELLAVMNDASEKDLERLPKIGVQLASRIVEHRPYKTLEEVCTKVSRIGPSTLKELKAHIASSRS
jgi:hypothetical protein